MSTSALQPFGPEIWLSDGPITEVVGFRYPTRMAVIRLPDRALLVWSPVALTDRLRGELEQIGSVEHLVAPNSLHHLFLREWREAYPRARLYAAPGLRERRADIVIDEELRGEAPPLWAGAVDYVLVGNRITTEAVFFHRVSGTVLFTDLLQQFPPGWFRGWRALVARLDLMTQPEPTVPRKFRAAFTDRRAAREAVRKVLAWPIEKVVMAHGTPVERDAQAFVERAFRWLRP
ncbi:MAG TPA: DUF4336 domain-containing protein [Caulobacteraceae bacterium]|nr:DUF4336 domain-containing protein [Caulobacteraceae bacterium]